MTGCEHAAVLVGPAPAGMQLVASVERQSGPPLSVYACTPCIEAHPRLRAARDRWRDTAEDPACSP